MPPSRRLLLWSGVVGGWLLVVVGGLVVVAGLLIDPKYADRLASRLILLVGVAIGVPAYALAKRCRKELRSSRLSAQSRPVRPQASSDSDASTTS